MARQLQVAIEANACDQVTNGRYLLGFGLATGVGFLALVRRSTG